MHGVCSLLGLVPETNRRLTTICPNSDPAKILDGRRSFPSGHSSTAFFGMTFLALYLAGLTGAWSLTRPEESGSPLRSKLARLVLTLLPLGFATWVAVSRVEDYVGTPDL